MYKSIKDIPLCGLYVLSDLCGGLKLRSSVLLQEVPCLHFPSNGNRSSIQACPVFT